MQSTKLWTRDFGIVFAVNFFLALVFYMLIVVIGAHAMQEYGSSLSQAGLVAGIFVIGTLLGRLIIGQFVDVLGRKKTMIIGMTAFTIASGLYVLSNSIPALIAVRFVHGLALGVGSTAAGTAVAHIIPRDRRAEGISYYSLSTTLAAAIGPFLGVWLLQHTNFNWIFAACVAIAIVGLLAAMRAQVPEGASHAGLRGFQFSLANLVEARAIPISVVTFVYGLCYASVLAFINGYAVELDLVTAASFFFIVYSAVVLLSRPLTGRLLDRKGSNMVVFPSCLFLALGLVVLANVQSAIGLLSAAVLIGIGFGNLQSALYAVAVKVVAPQRMGLATSTFYISMDASLGFGPYLLGLAISQIGYRNLYGSMAALAVLGLPVFYVLHGRHVARLRARDALAASLPKSE